MKTCHVCRSRIDPEASYPEAEVCSSACYREMVERMPPSSRWRFPLPRRTEYYAFEEEV